MNTSAALKSLCLTMKPLTTDTRIDKGLPIRLNTPPAGGVHSRDYHSATLPSS
jgi:hypothetical protein